MIDRDGRGALWAMLAMTVAALGPATPAVAAVDEQRAPSRLVRLVASLDERGPLVQADFAAIALDSMIDAYERELEKVYVAKRRFTRKEQAKQHRWAGAARAFLDGVYRAREALERGAALEIFAGSPVEVHLLIDDQLVPVVIPRIDHPRDLEDVVLSSFCALHPCDRALFDHRLDAPDAPRGGWSFRQGFGSTYVTVDGLGFMFSSVRDRAVKEEVCLRIAAELREVVGVLKRARALGVAIDWEAMQVIAPGRGAHERLQISTGGAGARLELPLLLRAPGVLAIARPWLQARVDDRAVEQLFPRADLLLANVLGPGG